MVTVESKRGWWPVIVDRCRARGSAAGLLALLVAVAAPLGAVAARSSSLPAAAAATATPARPWGTPTPLPAGAPHSHPLVRAVRSSARAAANTVITSSNWSGYVEQ